MNSRERILAACLLAIILLGGGAFLFRQAYLVPMRERNAAILAAQEEIETKRGQVRQALADKSQLERLRLLSLPADSDLARRDYEKYLNDLMSKSGFAPASFSVTPKPADARNVPMLGGKKPIYTRLTFTVLAHADLASLVKMLEGFYRTGLLHQIKTFSVQRPLTVGPQDRPNDLDINLTIEALIVSGAADRPQLLPNLDPRLMALDSLNAMVRGPAGLGLAMWAAGPTGPLGPSILASPSRRYEAIAGKDIFFGPAAAKELALPQIEGTPFVYLTDICWNDTYYEAFLLDRSSNKKTRLRNAQGFDRFRVRATDESKSLEGKLVYLGPRDLVFQAGERLYALHVGQSLYEALGSPISKEQLQALTQSTASTTKPAPPKQ